MAEEKRKILVEVDENIDQVSGKLGPFGNLLQGAKAGFLGMTQAARAFLATPIGAIIGALVAVLGPLISFLTKTQEGIEKVRVVTAQVGAVFDVFRDRISQVGKALFEFGRAAVQFLSGNFSAAADTARNATDLLTTSFDGLGKELSEEIKLVADLEKRLIALEKAENDYLLTRAERESQIARLRLLVKDENIALDERIAALQKATTLEKENAAEAIALQKRRVDIAQQEFDRAESTEQDRRKLIEERVKLIELETQSLNNQRKIASELATLIRQQEVEITKQKKEIVGQAEIIEKETVKIETIEAESFKKRLAQTTKFISEDLARKKAKIDAEIALEKLKSETIEQATIRSFSAFSRIAGEQTAAGIALNLASAIASTYSAANKALDSGLPPPANFFLAAATIAEGLANVTQIIRAARQANISANASVSASSSTTPITFTPEVVRFNQTDATRQRQTVNASVSVEEIRSVSSRVSAKENASTV